MTLPSDNDNHSYRARRAVIVAETLRCVLAATDGVSFHAISNAVQERTALDEETAWLEAQDAMEFLAVLGICLPDVAGKTIVLGCFGPDIVFRPSNLGASFMAMPHRPTVPIGEMPF